jgi:hypothetical protein
MISFFLSRRALLSVSAVTLATFSSGCAVAQTAPTPTTSKISNISNIGVGLEGLSDYSRAQMFADVMKTSRAWGKVEQPWVHEVKTDAQGWPTEDAGVIALVDTAGIEGTYPLSFDGKADVRGHSKVKVENLKFDAATKRSTAEVVVPVGETQIFLSFTNTDGGVRNVKLMRPGTTEKETFSKPFLEKVAHFSTLRFMDVLSTNNNPTKTWADRTTPQHASQTRPQGAALEYVVELANVSGKDIWVNVPDQADDDYVRRMATFIKDGLKKNQKVYVEWSNEVWNWQFQQAGRNLEAAKVEGKLPDSPLAFDNDTNEGYWGMRRIAKRSVEVGRIFRDVFGDKDFSRVRPVYATQVGYEEVYKQGLAFLENQYKQPNTVLYGLAGAPYFQVSEELSKKKDLSVDEIFAGIPDDMKKNLDFAATLGSFARYYGLKHLAYEGGQHLQDHFDVGNGPAKIAANRDPRMGEAVEKYLDGWNAIGGDLFMYFTLSSGYSKWGSWGLVEDISKTSPKYDAALRVIAKPRAELSVGAPLGKEFGAGEFSATNRWDKKGSDKVGIEPNKWLQYAVRVPKAGSYKLSMNIESSENAKADLLANAQPGGVIEIAPNAATASTTVKLDAGLNVVRIVGTAGRFSLKSLTVN